MNEKRYGDGRAAVICRLDTLRTWIAEGRTLRSFYDQHQEVLPVSYSHFTRLAKTYLPDSTPHRRSKAQRATAPAQHQHARTAAKPVRDPTPASTPQAATERFKRFEYNPVPDTDQLI